MAWTAPRTWTLGELVSSSIMNTHVRDNLEILKVPLNDEGRLSFESPGGETLLATDTLTVLTNYHQVGAESGTADDFDTIDAGTGVVAGHIVVVRPTSGDTITVKHNAIGGNIKLFGGADLILDDVRKHLALIYDGVDWNELTAGGGGYKIEFDDTALGTTAVTTEEVLRTWTIPANTLVVTGKTLRLTAAGTLENDAQTKTIRIRLGGVSGTICVEEAETDSALIHWQAQAYVVRQALNSQRVWGTVMFTGSGGVQTSGAYMPTTGSPPVAVLASETETSSIDLVVTGQNGTADPLNITYEASVLETLG